MLQALCYQNKRKGKCIQGFYMQYHSWLKVSTTYLNRPQFDCPINWWCEEEMWEVNRSESCMSADTCHRTLVSLVGIHNASLTSMTASCLRSSSYHHIKKQKIIINTEIPLTCYSTTVSANSCRKIDAPVNTAPSSEPTMKLLTSPWGKANDVTATARDCLCWSSIDSYC